MGACLGAAHAAGVENNNRVGSRLLLTTLPFNVKVAGKAWSGTATRIGISKSPSSPSRLTRAIDLISSSISVVGCND